MIELVITLVLIGILIAVALPGFNRLLANSQIRSVAEVLQNGLRLARAEAMRLNQQTVFSLTADTPAAGATAAATGRNWSIQTIPLTGSLEAPVFVQGGPLGDVSSTVYLTGAQAAICFNANGRLSAPASTGQPGATCAVADRYTYAVGRTGSDRPLNVTVSSGGRVRMCDPARTYSASAPDGCS